LGFFLSERASSIGRRLPLVKLPISSRGKESRRWVGERVVEEGVPAKWKKKKQEVKKEFRKKMKMRIIKK